jgi:hypothetical protein
MEIPTRQRERVAKNIGGLTEKDQCGKQGFPRFLSIETLAVDQRECTIAEALLVNHCRRILTWCSDSS